MILVVTCVAKMFLVLVLVEDRQRHMNPQFLSGHIARRAANDHISICVVGILYKRAGVVSAAVPLLIDLRPRPVKANLDSQP